MISESLQANPVIAALGDLAVAAKFEFEELTVEVRPENILAALAIIKETLHFEQLTTVTAVDRYPAEPRFELVYHLHSFSQKERLRLKAWLSGEKVEIESACPVYRSANWYEREVFDFFGIRFLNHPNLTRIMMPDDWEGYPLRKDYPVTGTRY
ncbi:MAG TPA: NADH-quinone oxidoreductase subunit C [Bryobacteraceae bacterium]|jgi:NADH-quinone oxidoreductase subunit C|nr:NADH-quinone oxidoreductase subunit C [Bryobacteraceae bacterium]